jgi:hypothetical protein
MGAVLIQNGTLLAKWAQPVQISRHINVLELQAIHLFLRVGNLGGNSPLERRSIGQSIDRSFS